jgi:hypothetical protein
MESLVLKIRWQSTDGKTDIKAYDAPKRNIDYESIRCLKSK